MAGAGLRMASHHDSADVDAAKRDDTPILPGATHASPNARPRADSLGVQSTSCV